MQVALTLPGAHEYRFDRAAQPSPTEDLSPLEREVVAIGRADAEDGALVGGNSRFVESLREVVAVITGRRRAKPLADPRLEALRRFSQRAALGCELITDVRTMRDAGYTARQIVIAARLARRH